MPGELQSETSNDRFILDLVELGVLPRAGTFFECGAADGVGGSSTYELETRLGWSGILAEAIEGAAEVIRSHRPRSVVVPLAVTGRDDQRVEFVEAGPLGSSLSYYSGVRTALEETSERFRRQGGSKDEWRSGRRRSYIVSTITLDTIFRRHLAGRAPTVCCLDMEGSELDALGGLDLIRRRPLMFTIEGSECNSLLRSRGYVRVSNPFNTTKLWEEYFVDAPLFETHRAALRERA